MTLSPAHRVLVGVCLLGTIVTAGLVLSPSAVIATVASLSTDPVRFAPVVVALYLLRPLFAWPTTPLAVVVGYSYGIWLGIPIALVGVICTVIPVYVGVQWMTTGRSAGAAACSSTDYSGPFAHTLEHVSAVIAQYYETAGPLRGVTASRLAPIPSDVTTAAAAVSGVRLRTLLLGTAVGELPWTVAAVVVGASAATATAGGITEIGPRLGIACGLAALLLLAGPAYRLARTHLTTAKSPRREST